MITARITKKSLFLLLLSITAGGILPGFSKNLRFQNLQIEDGLAQNTVTCILSDRRGFMWFGGEGGLSRYDGYNFKIYSHCRNGVNCLSNDQVNNMVEDDDGSFWIGTIDGGLNHFDPYRENFTCFRNATNNSNSLSNDSVRVILPVGEGILWIGTDNGLNKFDSRHRIFSRYLYARNISELKSQNAIYSLYQDKSGTIWVGTGNGLYYFDSARKTFNHFQIRRDDSSASRHNQINAMFEDGKGTLWLGTEAGLVRFDKQNRSFNFKVDSANPLPHLYNSRIFHIYCDNQNRVWVATESGIYVFPGMSMIEVYFRAGAIPQRLLANCFIISIFQDREDVVWAGTLSGIYKYDLKTRQFALSGAEVVSQEGEFSIYQVTAVCQDSVGNLWLGTYKKGLIKLNRGLDEKIAVFSFPGDPLETKKTIVSALLVGRDQTLWLGTNMGMHAYDIGKNIFQAYYRNSQMAGSLSDSRVTVFLEDRSDRLWVGTRDGLNLFDRAKGIFTAFRNEYMQNKVIGNNYITAICQDSLGAIWVGTYGGGLSGFDPDKGVFKETYRHRDNDFSSLSSDKIYCLLEDRHGQFWIGTKSGGLNRFDRGSGKFISFTSEDGLANNDILGLLEDRQGNLWMSTNRGLCQFNPQNKTFRNFYARDGLQGDEFMPMSFYRGRDQEMFFGGSNGLTSFFPEKIKANPYVPPVIITNIKIYNRNRTISGNFDNIKKIELGPRDTVVSFAFAALSYSDSRRNQYAYKIEGLNNEWIEIGNRHEITISNLRSGDYVFRVKGSNNNGVWNEQGTSLAIHVSFFWWMSWWFRVPVILLLIFFFILLNRSRTRRLAARIKNEAAMDQFFSKYNISQREKEIVFLLLKGKSNKEIEDQLFIAMGTVKNHTHNIYQKIGIKSRAQLSSLFKNLQIK